MPYPELSAILTDIGSEASEMEFSEASALDQSQILCKVHTGCE